MAKKTISNKAAEVKKAEDTKKVVSATEVPVKESKPAIVKPEQTVVAPTEKTAKVETDKKPVKAKATKKQADKETNKPESVEEIYIQYGADEYLVNSIADKAKEIFVSEGHRAATIKTLRIYVKPEEKMAYYVINDKVSGKFEI